MGLINIIMGLIIFILIGGVIVYLLIFSMKKKQTKWLMAIIILLFIGYLGAVVMTAYKQQYEFLDSRENEKQISFKDCSFIDYVITKNKTGYERDQNIFLLQNYPSSVFKSTLIYKQPECLSIYMQSLRGSKKKYVMLIYDEKSRNIIYRIEKLPTK